MRRAGLLLALAACGRIDFDALVDGKPVDGTGVSAMATYSQLTLAPPAEVMTDYPVLVVLDDTRAQRVRLADGASVRFLDSDGNLIPHEIEQVGAPGGLPFVAWVRVQIPSSGTTITVEYGPGVPAPSSLPVWSADFAAVWHFRADGNVTDSTGNGLGLSPVGTHTVDAMAGPGVSLDGVQTQYLATSVSTPALSQFTVSAFMWARAFGGFQGGVTRQYGNNNTGDNDVYLGVFGNNAVLTCEISTSEVDAVGTRALGIQTWYYLTGTATSVAEKVYVDGALDSTVATGVPLVSNPFPIFVGADRSSTAASLDVPDANFFNGIIDEARLQTVARSDAWVDYDARAVRDQVITYGPVIEPPGP